VGFDQNLDLLSLSVPVTAQADVLKDETGKMLNGVQNGFNLQLHRWSSGLMRSIAFANDWINRRPVFFYPACAILFCGWGDRALQECNLSTQRLARALQESIAPSPLARDGSGFLFSRNASAITAQSEKLIVPLGRQAAIFHLHYPQILLQTRFSVLRTFLASKRNVEAMGSAIRASIK
jgi:hypothetical protein